MSKLFIETLDYTKIFPFNVRIIYKKGGVFSSMIKEVIPTHPELIECFTGDSMDTIANAQAFVCRTGSSIFMFMTDDMSLDVLVHECTHVTFRVYDIIGAYPSDEAEEFYAYITEAVFRDVYRLCKDTFKLKMKPYFE